MGEDKESVEAVKFLDNYFDSLKSLMDTNCVTKSHQNTFSHSWKDFCPFEGSDGEREA